MLINAVGLDAARADECPVSLPVDSPVASDQLVLGQPGETHGWYGTEQLAALVPIDGKWTGVGSSFGNKFWWWRNGFDARQEPAPELVITGVHLDGTAPSLKISNATAGMGERWQAMLVGMHFPASGCWELRGTYNGVEELILVLEVGP